MRYFIIIMLISLSPVKVNPVIRFTRLVCNSTHPMTVYEKCRIVRVNSTTTTVTIKQKLMQTIHSVYANVSLIQLSKSLNRVLYTFNNVDACAFMLRRRNPVLRLLFSHFQKFSNANHSCPFKGSLIVNHLAISDIQISRLPIIAGEYGLLTSWKLNGENAADVQVFVKYS